MIHIDSFSGLGLFSYAADYVWNLEHIFCEIEDWPYKFLKQEYPNARIERDVKTFDGTEYAGRTFLLTAGVPCQPASVAGKRKGTEDDRWLWPEAIRVMAEAQPEWCIFENPLGILTLEKGLVFENLLLEMESQGYAVQPYIIPACAIGAIHRRNRVWIVVNRNQQGRQQIGGRNKIKDGRRTNNVACNKNATNSSITRSGELSESDRRHDSADIERKGSYVTDSNRFNGNNAGHGSGEIRGKLRKEAEIQGCEHTPNTEKPGLEGSDTTRRTCSRGWLAELSRISGWQKEWPEVATELCRMDVSSTDRVHRLKALGNTIQWEVAMAIMQRIKKTS